MKTELYTIYDNVAKEAGPVFQAKNFDVAMRYVNQMIKDLKFDINAFDLIRLGTFDTESVFLSVFPEADLVNLSNVPTYVADVDEFMKADLTEEVKE